MSNRKHTKIPRREFLASSTKVAAGVSAATAVAAFPIQLHAESMENPATGTLTSPALAGIVSLDRTHLAPGNGAGGGVIRAFVATGSKSPIIFGTIQGVGNANGIANSTLSCTTLSQGGQDGVLISIWYRGPFDTNGEVKVSLLQLGATKYSSPIFTNVP